MDAFVRLAAVSKIFAGGVTAVDAISLDIAEGEFVTFLGASGCGKTTSLRMIAGFESPTAGKIYLDGEDVTERPPYQRNVNTVFQDYALFPHMSVAENVAYGLKVAGVAKPEIRARVGEILDTVGLSEKAFERPASLSGGQKQRVALARALVRYPQVLLLDEPLSALDAKLREAMQVELKQLHHKLGLTFVYVTHDQREALVMSDRVVVMKDGRIEQVGTPQAIYDQPETLYVATFVGTSNLVAGRVVGSDPSGLKIETPNGVILARGGDFSPGEQVTVAVRPEKSRILNGRDPAASSVLEGVLTDTLFHGGNFRFELDMNEADPFFVDQQLSSLATETDVPARGARLKVGLSPESLSVFARDPGA